MLFGWVGLNRCFRSTQHNVADNIGSHIGAVRWTEIEVPETEDENKLARNHGGDFESKLGFAVEDVVGVHCWAIRRMHINMSHAKAAVSEKVVKLD